MWNEKINSVSMHYHIIKRSSGYSSRASYTAAASPSPHCKTASALIMQIFRCTVLIATHNEVSVSSSTSSLPKYLRHNVVAYKIIVFVNKQQLVL